MIALLEASISMSVIALVYMAITPLLSKKFTAKGRYYTWLVVIIGLIIPFRFHPQASAIYVDTLIPALKTINGQATAQAINQVTITSSTFPWSMLIGGLWISGVIVFMAYHVIRHRRFLKMVKRWSTEVVDLEVLNRLHVVQVDLGIKQQVNLRVCPGISSPMLLGFIRPTILLPSGNIPEDELPLIFKHELVHCKRRDVWYKALVFLATALHWFNPFVYLMAREISIQCELSCDEEVVKNTDIGCRQKYVEAIIGIIRKQSKGQSKFSTNFYSGKQGMRQRVFSIMDARSKQWGISIFAAVMIATLSTGTMLKVSAPISDESRVKVEVDQSNQNDDPISSVDKDENTSEPDRLEDLETPQLIIEDSEVPQLIEGEGDNAAEPDDVKLVAIESPKDMVDFLKSQFN